MSESIRSKPRSEPPPVTDGEFTAADLKKGIADRKGQIRDHLKRLGLFHDLDTAKCDRLTDIVLKLDAGYSWSLRPRQPTGVPN